MTGRTGDSPTLDARARLLETIIDELDRNGLGQRSLRDLATAVGTSHRMLIYHFGSHEGLLVEVVHTVNARDLDRFADLQRAGTADPLIAFRETWRILTMPSNRGRERLFFECYVRAMSGEHPFATLLPEAVTGWVDRMATIEMARGFTRREARSRARAALALVRGLLLDLLATGDRAGTTAALEAYLTGGRPSGGRR